MTPDQHAFPEETRLGPHAPVEPDCAPRAGSPPILERLRRHRAMMAPHQLHRETGQLFVDALAEIERVHDMALHLARKLNIVLGLNEQEVEFVKSIGGTFESEEND